MAFSGGYAGGVRVDLRTEGSTVAPPSELLSDAAWVAAANAVAAAACLRSSYGMGLGWAREWWGVMWSGELGSDRERCGVVGRAGE